jgi:hypothetical protein
MQTAAVTAVVRSQVTGQYLCGFAKSPMYKETPVWGDKSCAVQATVAALAKCHLAGIFAVDVEHCAKVPA